MKYIAITDRELSQMIGDLREMHKATGYLEVVASNEKKRSLDQNAISHTWYTQVSVELREQSVRDVKRECKLLYGVPILRAESEEFRELYDSLVKGRFSYEEKLQMMDLLPVTSLMTKKQLSQYLETMQKAYADRVYLEFPNEA